MEGTRGPAWLVHGGAACIHACTYKEFVNARGDAAVPTAEKNVGVRIMLRLGWWSFVLLMLVQVGLPGNAAGNHYPNPLTLADGSTIEITDLQLGEGAAIHLYFGATIGLNWSAMPDRQLVNWIVSGPEKKALDISGDVYLTGVSMNGGAYVQDATPDLLRDQSWFEGGPYVTGPHIPVACCFYHDCPDTGEWQHLWSGTGSYTSCVYSCPAWAVEQYENFNRFQELFTSPGGGLENGVLRLLDGHGGAVGIHLLVLETMRMGVPAPGEHTHYLLLFAYVPPGRYLDTATQQLVDRFPGDTFPLSVFVSGAPIEPIAVVVQHVSADIAGTSPDRVDASDLAALAARVGNCASFCTQVGCQPDGTPPYCTWHGDLNCDGSIDAADISVWAHQDALDNCALSKAGDPVENQDEILAWFGMMKTGGTVFQCGSEMPEIVVVDEAQMKRAIADPYGYMTTTAAVESMHWSRVKALYR